MNIQKASGTGKRPVIEFLRPNPNLNPKAFKASLARAAADFAEDMKGEIVREVWRLGAMSWADPFERGLFEQFRDAVFDELDAAANAMLVDGATEASCRTLYREFHGRFACLLEKWQAKRGKAEKLLIKENPDLADRPYAIVGSYIFYAPTPEESAALDAEARETMMKAKAESKSGVDYDLDLPYYDDDEDAIEQWREPVDILGGSFEPPELKRGLLPKLIEDYAFITADTMGVDPGGVAMGALAASSGVITDDIVLKMKKHSGDWLEPARPWIFLVGDPATKKSPVMRATLRPVRALESLHAEDFRQEMDRWEAMDKEKQAEHERPRRTSYLTENTTVEALQEKLRYSTHNKVIVFGDELSGLIGAMDKYSNGRGSAADRAAYLQGYNGGSMPVDRVTRGSFLIPNWSLVLYGGIQPSVVRLLASSAYDDGLLQRANVVVMRSGIAGKDEPVPKIADDYFKLVADRLPDMRPPQQGQVLRFDEGAQELRNHLEAKHLKLMTMQNINKKLAGHIGKMDGMFGRYCTLFHCIEHANDKVLPLTVTLDTAQRVADFFDTFLFPHAMAFYAGVLGLSDDQEELTQLAGFILAHDKIDMTFRDAQRGLRTFRKMDHRTITKLYEQMESLGWLARRVAKKAGPRPDKWEVNPKLQKLFAKQADRERESRAAARELILTNIATKRGTGK